MKTLQLIKTTQHGRTDARSFFWGRSTQSAPNTGSVRVQMNVILDTHTGLFQTAVCLVSAPPHVSATDCSHHQGAVII